MATPRDIAVRFIVTDNEISESLEKIKSSAARAKTAIGEVGDAEVKLTAGARRAAQEYLKVNDQWDKSSKFAAQYLRVEQRLLEQREKGRISEEQYRQTMEKTRHQLAQTYAEEVRINEERRRRIAASPAAQGPSQIISVPATNNLRTARGELEKFHATSRGMLGTINDVSFKFFVLTFAARQVAEVLLRTFVQSGEQVEKFRIRMEALTGSTQVFDQIFTVAQELGVGFEALGQTFNRFAIANRTMGLTNDQLVLMTRNIAALGLIGGGTVQEISSGMQQLGQGMASGKLAGDELRSVMENLPYLALKLAESLGVGVGQLRAMGSTGELTGKKMAAAFVAMKDEIDKLLKDIPMTSERALAQVANSWSKLVNEALRSVGVETAGESISGISKWIDGLTEDLEANSVAFGRWLEVIRDIAPAVLGLVVAVGGLKALTGVGLAFATMRENMLKTAAAIAAYKAEQVRATAASIAATAAGNAQAAAENKAAAATAARALSTAKWGRVAMVATAAMNPYVLLLGAAATALYAYSKAEDDATASLDDHIQKLKEMSKYDIQGMSRKQLQGLSGQIAVDIEANNREVAKLYDERKALQDKLAGLNKALASSAAYGYGEKDAGMGAVAQQAVDAQIELDRLGAKQEELQENSTTLKVAQRNVQDAINGVSNAAQDGIDKIKDYADTMKDLEKALKKSSESLRDVRDEIRLMSLYGVDEGKRMAERQRAVHDYVQAIKGALSEDLTPPPMPRTKEMEDEYQRRLNNQRAVLDTAQQELRNQLDLIDAKKIQNEIEEKGREADKAYNRSTNRLGSMDDYVPRMEMKKKLDALLAEIAGASQEAVNDAVTRFVTNNNIPARQAEALRYLLTNQIKEAGAKLEIKAADISKTGLTFGGRSGNALPGWDKTNARLRAEVKRLAQDMEKDLGIKVIITSTYRSGDKGNHGTGNAIDIVPTDMKRAAEYWNAHSSEYALSFPVKTERPGDSSAKAIPWATGPNWHAQLAGGKKDNLPNLDQWLDDMVRATESGRENMARWVDQNAELARKNYVTLATITAEGEAEIAKVREQARQEGISGAVLDERIQLIRAKTAQAQQDLLDQQSDFELETQRMQLETTDIYITDAERRARDVLAIELDAQMAEKEVLANRVITHEEAQRRIDVIWERARSDQRKIEMEELKKVTDDVGMAFGQAFGSLASLEKPRDVLKQLLETLRDMIVQLLIIEPLARAISGYLGGMFGGGIGGAATPGLASMGDYSVVLPTLHAKGGVVSTSLPQGVYSQPTYFPMKTPGLHAFATGTGLLGEAGPEAVMPLTRINGKLGVKSDGGGGIKVVVNNNAPGVRVDARETPGGLTLEIVEAHVAASLANGGNRISRAAESAYPGLRRGRL